MNLRIQPLLYWWKLIVLFVFFCGTASNAQVSERILSVNVGEGTEGEPLQIQAQLATAGTVTQILLAYRPFGASEYKQYEMSVTGNTATITVPGSQVVSPSIEYYLLLKIQGKDSMETYPVENPQGHPFQLQVRTATKEKSIVFLSPEPGASVRTEDLFVSISLVGVSPTVDKKATKIFIDDRDVTASAEVTEELITLSPENIQPPIDDGPHNIRVEVYDKEGKIFTSSGLSFSQLSAASAEAIKLNYNVSAQLESRNETINSTSIPYNRATLNASSDYGPLRVNGRFYLTNEDKDDRQPQNRYYIEGLVSSWLRVGYGDGYPVFPSLIMNGKRLRGLTSNLKLGFFNLDFASGDVVRKIGGDTIQTFPKDSLKNFGNNSSVIPFGDTTGVPDSLRRYALVRYGTYTRSLTVIHPSFGSGDNFQWGFSYLKAKDDVGSINYGTRPQENIALGTDLLYAMDSHRFELTGQGALSIVNTDIQKGSLSDSDIDSLFKDADSTKKRQDLKDLRDKISDFITVNQNLVPLSIDKLSSVMAYEGAAVLNYFSNYLKASYIFRGSQYRSFGQTFLRNDVKGYNIFDRIRLFENQFFFSVGIEQLKDNTDDSKVVTTTFSNDNFTLSYYPRINFPNVTVGYGINNNSNGLTGSDTAIASYDTSTQVGRDAYQHARSLFLSSIEDETNRFYIQLGYSFTAGLQHNAILNVSTSSRTDETFHHADTKNIVISTLVTTTWSSPLQTTAGLTLNFNQLPNLDLTSRPLTFDSTQHSFILKDFNYTTFLFNARYRMMQDKLLLSGIFSPTFGDFSRLMWGAGADYLIVKDVHALLQLNMLNNSGAPTDFIGSLMLKYNM